MYFTCTLQNDCSWRIMAKNTYICTFDVTEFTKRKVIISNPSIPTHSNRTAYRVCLNLL